MFTLNVLRKIVILDPLEGINITFEVKVVVKLVLKSFLLLSDESSHGVLVVLRMTCEVGISLDNVLKQHFPTSSVASHRVEIAVNLDRSAQLGAFWFRGKHQFLTSR